MKRGQKILKIVGIVFSIILETLAILLACSTRWMFRTWTNLSMDELVYHLTAPLEGTNTDMIQDYCGKCAVPAIIFLCAVIIIYAQKKNETVFTRRMTVAGLVGAVVIIGATAGITWKKLDAGDYVKGQSTYSTFIDKNYVDPAEVNIEFPEQKKNLIYIFLESMEMTYADEAAGGAFETNLIPELTELSKKNENFSGDSDELNGGIPMPGTTWTMGAMFGQTSGLPLNISIDDNAMDTQESFFPGIITLGDILQEEGYSQTLLIGSDATFGGRKLYFTDHGQYDIVDYEYAVENKMIPEDYKVWWGYEDEKLFGFAKERLLELSKQDDPFNLTMLTVDTHFEDGYVCELCPDTFGDNQYANVMACSSKQVKEFVDWIQEQDFADDTTIVISGDHLTMDSDFCDDVEKSYQRKVYTTYINSSVEKETDDKRTYTTFDAFPTTLAALGANIDGNRLGLGTNLYSSTQTLSERYGVENEKTELKKKSKLMNKLAKIDKNRQALLKREGKAPIAEVVTGKYQEDSLTLPVTVKNMQYITNGIQSVSLAIWKNEDQSDLQWLPMAMFEDGHCKADIDFDNLNENPGTYNIQIYIVDGDGEPHMVAETTAEIP